MPIENEVIQPQPLDIQPDGSAMVNVADPVQEKVIQRMSELKEVANILISIENVTDQIFPSYYSEQTFLTGEKMLEEMGQVVSKEYEQDLESRSVWEENTAEQLKLFTSFMDIKTSPWDKCSNVNLPLLTVAALQFHARAYDALLPAKGAVQVVNTGDEDIERGERVGKYMNFQLYYEIKDFEEGMDKTLLQLPIVGCVFRKTYYDEVKQIVTSSYISAADFVVNYGAYNLDSAPRKTHILYMDKNDVRKRVKEGIFTQKAWDLAWDASYKNAQVPRSPIKEMIDKVIGETDVRTDNIPRIILEQHRLWDIDQDGIAEPVVITVDYLDKKVLRVTDRRVVNFDTGKEEIIEYFTKYTFIPNPEGFYDLGFGTLIRGLNESANTIVNEVIDAGSLANLQGGFFVRRSGLKKGNLKFKMGEYQEVDTHLDDLHKAIYSFDFRGPNQTLYSVLGLLYEYSKLVSSISETMTGQLPASDTPASTVLALIEEGRKVFSSIHKRIHRAFKQELAKVYRLNSVFMDEKKYFKALGDTKIPQGNTMLIGRSDFKGTLDVIPVSDPNITSAAEKIMKAEQALKNIVELDPQNANALFVARKHYFESLDIPNISEYLQPPPEPPDLAPEEENAAMLMERPATVLPQQDHLHHLDVLEDLITGTYSGQLTPTAKKLVEGHKREHIAGSYLQFKGGQPPKQGVS